MKWGRGHPPSKESLTSSTIWYRMTYPTRAYVRPALQKLEECMGRKDTEEVKKIIREMSWWRLWKRWALMLKVGKFSEMFMQ